MLYLKYKNLDVIVTITEDTKPYICGFKKNDDIFYAIEINIYRNSNGRQGKFIARYSYMWKEPVYNEVIYSFIADVLEKPSYRKDYQSTTQSWLGSIQVDLTSIDISQPLIILDDENIVLRNNKVKSSLKLSNIQSIDSNLSIKLDVLSLLITDDEINTLKINFSNRADIIYAAKLIIQGLSIEEAVAQTNAFMQNVAF